MWSLLTSPETWDHLVRLCGWNASQYQTWLRRALNLLVITNHIE